MGYVNQFLKLKCSGDVLNIVSPMGNPEKEITESMAIIKRIKSILIGSPLEYTVYDLCAGNALTSVLSAFLLPVKEVIAIDKRERYRPFEKVKKFSYQFQNIYEVEVYGPMSILISVHPCQELAKEVIRQFFVSQSQYLFLMPCCVGKFDKMGIDLDNLSIYEKWALSLRMYTLILSCMQNVPISCSIERDKQVLSPANIILKIKRL